MDWEGEWDNQDHPAFITMQHPPRFDGETPSYVVDSYAAWQSACGGRDLPRPERLSASFFTKQALPYVGVMHVDHGARRLKIRLSGTGVRNMTGVEFTGFYTDQIPGAEDANIRFHWCAKNGRPYSVVGQVTWPSPRSKRYGVLALPFGETRASVEKVALVFSFF